MSKAVAKKTKLTDKSVRAAFKRRDNRKPIWGGPTEEGITQSLLARFLCDREKFRLTVVEGLAPIDTFQSKMEFGNLWHACEEALAGSGNPIVNNPVAEAPWLRSLISSAQALAQRYPGDQKEVEKWYQVIKRLFPIYVDYWKHHPDVTARQPLYQEQVFKVPYKLPSGRVVLLRGKFDSVDEIDGRLWLQENKSRSKIDVPKVLTEIPFDLQTGLYMTALSCEKPGYAKRLGGVRYNMVVRPLSGWGEFALRQRTGRGAAKVGAESDAEFYDRVAATLQEQLGSEETACKVFARVKYPYTAPSLKLFQLRILNPILEQLCDWWEWLQANPFNPFEIKGDFRFRPQEPGHFIFPTGIYNPALEGVPHAFDNYLLTGDMIGLRHVTSLFPELE